MKLINKSYDKIKKVIEELEAYPEERKNTVATQQLIPRNLLSPRPCPSPTVNFIPREELALFGRQISDPPAPLYPHQNDTIDLCNYEPDNIHVFYNYITDSKMIEEIESKYEIKQNNSDSFKIEVKGAKKDIFKFNLGEYILNDFNKDFKVCIWKLSKDVIQTILNYPTVLHRGSLIVKKSYCCSLIDIFNYEFKDDVTFSKSFRKQFEDIRRFMLKNKPKGSTGRLIDTPIKSCSDLSLSQLTEDLINSAYSKCTDNVKQEDEEEEDEKQGEENSEKKEDTKSHSQELPDIKDDDSNQKVQRKLKDWLKIITNLMNQAAAVRNKEKISWKLWNPECGMLKSKIEFRCMDGLEEKIKKKITNINDEARYFPSDSKSDKNKLPNQNAKIGPENKIFKTERDLFKFFKEKCNIEKYYGSYEKSPFKRIKNANQWTIILFGAYCMLKDYYNMNGKFYNYSIREDILFPKFWDNEDMEDNEFDPISVTDEDEKKYCYNIFLNPMIDRSKTKYVRVQNWQNNFVMCSLISFAERDEATKKDRNWYSIESKYIIFKPQLDCGKSENSEVEDSTLRVINDFCKSSLLTTLLFKQLGMNLLSREEFEDRQLHKGEIILYGHEFKCYNQSYMKPYAFLPRYYASVELNQ